MARTPRLIAALLFGGALAWAGCQGPAGPPGENGKDGTNGTSGTDGKDGTNGTDGKDGTNGTNGTDGTSGTNGTDGKPGKDGGNVRLTEFHGRDELATQAFDKNGVYQAKAAITAATADASGKVTVDFTVHDKDDKPITGVTGVSASIAKLVPPAKGESFNRWVPYVWRSQVVSGSAMGDWPNPDGTAADQGYRESDGTLTDNLDGSYTYVFKTNLTAVKTPVSMTAVPFEPTLRHRVSIMMGGQTGPTADASFDFVPDGSALAGKESRDIVQTAVCQSCHGPDFHGHGGDRKTVENCVTCHTGGSTDPHGGETLDFQVMIHKIHAGGELASIPGKDGKVWDDPATPVDESADNGTYAIWGFQNHKSTWWKSEFPAVLGNCQKCHDGNGANVDDWKNKPSRQVCGSCHDDVNFDTGVNHPGGQQPTDDNCSVCHKPTGQAVGKSVVEAHDWTKTDVRNLPEFDVGLTVSMPANGQYFVAGESPVVTIVLKDLENNGAVIDHTTVTADASAEGCQASPCPARDGLFMASNFFVHGPRADRNPVLTTKARVKITSTSAGPFDLSAAGASLTITFDGGKDIYTEANGGTVLPALVSVPVSAGSFASTAAATPQEIVTWLNGNANFKRRGIAYLEPNGKVSIRSRNLGTLYALQLAAGPVTTAVFGGDTSVKVIGGFTPAVSIAKQANPNNNDPKVQWFTDHITYTLDPVDDLKPGTYVVDAEIADRGRKSDSDYKTPSVAKITFQVGTATEEAPPTRNCNSCHQGPDGRGLVLDAPRHSKHLGDLAVDQCGSCHDYQTQTASGQWSGGYPISKRVHAVHNGANLTYPVTTVGHDDVVPGRFWDIEFPQDVRNCEACHNEKTSGSWKTKAARLPCWGCHDSDAARAHMKIQTFDPTPNDPWSGDEEESCQTCH
jgi:predicted CXXCH cytochrome family protein